MTTLALLVGFTWASEAESVIVAPGQLRVMVLADTAPTTAAAGAELSPTLPGGRYLYLPGSALPEAHVDTLMGALGPNDARAVAGLVASGEAVVGQLVRSTRDVDVTESRAGAPRCRHARIESVVLTLAAGGPALRGQRALPDRAEATPGACPPVSVAP